jgi:type IV pilus assembly protein PilC
MTTFAYTARDASGRSVSGTLAAPSMGEVLQMLRAEGKYPVSVRPADLDTKGAAFLPSGGIKIARADVIQVSTQLAIMLETGVTLNEALECIARQSEKPRVRMVMTDLCEQLQAGNSFSDSLSRHPRSFPTLYVALIRASEKSGMMARLLNRATAYLRDEQETIRKVKGALTYPAIMFAFAITTTTFLLAFVLPRFTAIYANKKAALPGPTRFLMALSDFLVNDWMLLVAAIATTIVAAFFYVRTNAGARLWHFVQLNVPLFGKLYRKLHLARGLRMCGTMAGAGVQLLECVKTAHDLCPNTYFRDLWQQAEEQIQAGKQLSEPLFASPLVPRSVAQMLYSGEKSGKLAMVMEQVSTYAELELKEQITNMTRYIEPLMIVVMGLIIGGVALALLLPIFTISKVLAQ